MKKLHARAVGALLVVLSASVAACAAESDAPSSTSDLAGATIDAPPGDRSSAGGDEPLAVGPNGEPVCPEGRWCSALYPPTWSAGDPADAEGRFLHDFSYAGYRYGEEPPESVPGATFDVVAGYGADPSGASDATGAVQAAIDAASAAGGGIVSFPAGTFRIGGMLTVGASHVVLRGAGPSTVLRFTKTTGMANHANLTFAGNVARDAGRALVADAPERSKEIFVADASDLAPGDDVAIGWTITPSFTEEHGMTGVWTAFAGKYEPFFRNKVAAVDTSVTPHKVTLDVPLRYTAKLRDGAAVQKESGYLREVGLEKVALSTAVAWDAAWAENRTNAVTLRDVADAWVRDVRSVPAPDATGRSASDTRAYHLRSGGILVEDAKRVSILGVTLENAQNRGSGGNGYLYEISRTSDVLVRDSKGNNGRHNFIQNWGFGNAGMVLLRVTSTGSEMLSLIGGVLTPEEAFSEHHHSLAMATLIDDCRLDDGFNFENRGAYSTGAGHTGTGSVVWRPTGSGKVISKQYGWGYVIGPRAGIAVETAVDTKGGAGTAPEDFVEGEGDGDTLYPASLYEDQRARRTAAR